MLNSLDAVMFLLFNLCMFATYFAIVFANWLWFLYVVGLGFVGLLQVFGGFWLSVGLLLCFRVVCCLIC